MAIDMMAPWFQYFGLPLAIFLGRIVDVSMGTLRVIFLSRGMRLLAPIIGFVEILIWLLAIGQIMKNLSNPVCYVAYAAGFAGGNYVGLLIEGKLAMGLSMVRIMLSQDGSRLKRFLTKAGYRLTSVPAQGSRGPVEVLFTVTRRRQLHRVAEIIRRCNPDAFYTVEDVRSARGVTSLPGRASSSVWRRRRLVPRRKGK